MILIERGAKRAPSIEISHLRDASRPSRDVVDDPRFRTCGQRLTISRSPRLAPPTRLSASVVSSPLASSPPSRSYRLRFPRSRFRSALISFLVVPLSSPPFALRFRPLSPPSLRLLARWSRRPLPRYLLGAHLLPPPYSPPPRASCVFAAALLSLASFVSSLAHLLSARVFVLPRPLRSPLFYFLFPTEICPFGEKW